MDNIESDIGTHINKIINKININSFENIIK